MSEVKASSYVGIGLGEIWGGVLSYLKWHSLGWAVTHSIFGWFYVIYYFIRY